LDGLANGELLCYLALVEDVMVGFAIVLPLDDLPIGFLEYLAVDPDHRNRGLGSRLMEHLRVALPEAPTTMQGLLLEVEPPSEDRGESEDSGEESRLRRRRIGFYERNGATVLDAARRYRAPDLSGTGTVPYWLMWLPLSNAAGPVPTGDLLRQYVTAILVCGYGLDEVDPLVSAVVDDLAC
jgi:ribosomal protein S18 acetylase RimI-like enzyme